MVRVYLADSHLAERSALRLLILDMGMDLVGEAADWPTVLAEVPTSKPHMLVVDWDLLPSSPDAAVIGLRMACPASLAVVLISHLNPHDQVALSVGADVFISRGEIVERVVDHFRAVARRFSI